MNLRLRNLLSRQTITNLSRLNPNPRSPPPPPSPISPAFNSVPTLPCPTGKSFHSSRHHNFSLSDASTLEHSPVNHNITVASADDSDASAMNEFLSRFVHRMRGNLNQAFPHTEKHTIDAMLIVIVDKLVVQLEKGGGLDEIKLTSSSSEDDLSEDLWRTVYDVSSEVYLDMERETKKEKMKKFQQSDEVKALTRFASEVGVRGDMLHELRFKWAKQAMEESEFYDGLRSYMAEDEEKEEIKAVEEGVEEREDGGGVGVGVGGLPKRHGKIKYKLYGLDLSGVEWKEVADKIHEAEDFIFPQEAKPITGKCKVLTEKIIAMRGDEEPGSLLAEWVELLQPTRVDWISLLEKMKEPDYSFYLKVSEHVLDEPSFQADIRDYSKLLDIHAKENRLEDAERILNKMSEKSMPLDMITLTTLVPMYSKAGNLERAKQSFESLKSLGFKPDMKVYSSMIVAYVNAGEPKTGEGLLREMETRGIKLSQEICMALQRAFAQRGDVAGSQRILQTMQLAGFEQTAESYSLLIEACGKSGNPTEARRNFDTMTRLGHKPDDKCTADMISAYEKKNELDKALHLLLQLEKDGFEPGIATYTVLVDWMGKLLLIDEAEQILGKIAQLGEAPPLKIQVSLCDMYSRAGMEKKALQALGVLEAKKDILSQEDFERIILGLLKGGFEQDVQRMLKMMTAQGFTPSEGLGIRLMTIQTLSSNRPGKRLFR